MNSTRDIVDPSAARSALLELADIVMFLQRHFLVSINASTSARRLSLPQYTLLSFLADGRPVSISHLSELMGHTNPATSGLVDRLEAAGLATRQSGQDDRRRVDVIITDEGRALVEAMKADLIEKLQAIRERLDVEDQDAWLRIYRVMRGFCEAAGSKAKSK